MPVLKKHRIIFSPAEILVNIHSGESLLDAARHAGIDIASDCGGKGRCGQCLVQVIEGDTGAPCPQELKRISPKELDSGYRLACCCHALRDSKIYVPEGSLRKKMRLQVNGPSVAADIDPVTAAFFVRMNPPSLKDPSADMNRVVSALKSQYGLNDITACTGAAGQLPEMLRQNGFGVTAFIRNSEITGFGQEKSMPMGVAIDLGTTKIAACLMDLTSGRQLAMTGAINPQSAHGDDIMSRLDFALHDASGCTILSSMVRDVFGSMIMELAQKAGVIVTDITDICVAGNTAMTHLFLGLPIEQLARSPYVAASNLSMNVRAGELGLKVCPGAVVHIMPGIGGYVGGDHVAMIMASGIDRKETVTLGVDIGTNTEIVIQRPDKSLLAAVSCPSGPAFEGAHVNDGMGAFEGAIEYVKLTNRGVDYRTIGGASPIGLCGSGIIDVMAELCRHGIIDEMGHFDRANKRVSKAGNSLEFPVAQNMETGKQVTVTQEDISEIQLAKAAVRAGIECLMEWTGTTCEMVGEVIIAGAFGSYTDLSNAVDIGLLPFFQNAVYRQAGNSALTGTVMALLSERERKRSQDIANRTKYLELTTYQDFNRRFAKALKFSDRCKGLDERIKR